MIDIHHFSSTNLNYGLYDSSSEVLLLRFHNGSLYAYHPMPAEVWDDMLLAESPGSFFINNIRNSSDYVCTRIT